MSGKHSTDEPRISLGRQLSETFDQVQERIRERAYRLFQDRGPGEGDSTADWMKAQSELLEPVELEIKDQKKKIVAECDLKGFSPQEIEVEVENGVLKVFGTHRESSSEKRDGGVTKESEVVYFYQSASLPAEVDLDEAEAKMFKNGKLKVTLPKR